MICKKAALKKYLKIPWKNLWWSPDLQLYQKKVFVTGLFHEQPWATDFNTRLTVFLIQIDKYDIKGFKRTYFLPSQIIFKGTATSNSVLRVFTWDSRWIYPKSFVSPRKKFSLHKFHCGWSEIKFNFCFNL